MIDTELKTHVNEYIKNLRRAYRKAIRFTIKSYRQNTKFDKRMLTDLINTLKVQTLVEDPVDSCREPLVNL